MDPWLVGNLQFGPEFLFSGVKKSLKDWKLEDFGNIDLIVLSQGLPDHTHVPTLKRIDKNIPVIASIKAARICHNLGFRNIQVLRHGDSFKFHSVEISAYKVACCCCRCEMKWLTFVVDRVHWLDLPMKHPRMDIFLRVVIHHFVYITNLMEMFLDKS